MAAAMGVNSATGKQVFPSLASSHKTNSTPAASLSGEWRAKSNFRAIISAILKPIPKISLASW